MKLRIASEEEFGRRHTEVPNLMGIQAHVSAKALDNHQFVPCESTAASLMSAP